MRICPQLEALETRNAPSGLGHPLAVGHHLIEHHRREERRDDRQEERRDDRQQGIVAQEVLLYRELSAIGRTDLFVPLVTAEMALATLR